MSDEPSDARSGPADRCPYCLGFPEMAAAQAAGTRFCPNCGADWETVDAPVANTSAPPDPFAIEADGVPAVEVGGFGGVLPEPTPLPPPRVSGSHPMVPPPGLDAVPTAVADPPKTPIGPVTIGLILGLAGTIAAAMLWERFFPPPATAPPAPVVVVRTIDSGQVEVEAEPEPEVARSPAVVAPARPKRDPAERAKKQARAVEDAIKLYFKGSPKGVLVKVEATVKDGIAYLDGEVDSQRRREAVTVAAGKVFGIKAVDARKLKVVYRQHTVEAGDTLGRLAKYYYGSAAKWKRILVANPGLGPTTNLQLGTVVNIPMDED